MIAALLCPINFPAEVIRSRPVIQRNGSSRDRRLPSRVAVPITPTHYEAIHAVLFYTQLTFVVTHEFTHHVHGHLLQSALDSAFSNEIVDSHDDGNLEAQAQEIDADCYAAYHVLAHLIEGSASRQLWHERARRVYHECCFLEVIS